MNVAGLGREVLDTLATHPLLEGVPGFFWPPQRKKPQTIGVDIADPAPLCLGVELHDSCVAGVTDVEPFRLVDSVRGAKKASVGGGKGSVRVSRNAAGVCTHLIESDFARRCMRNHQAVDSLRKAGLARRRCLSAGCESADEPEASEETGGKGCGANGQPRLKRRVHAD